MIRTGLKVKTAAATNAITTADAKDMQLKVDWSDATQNTHIDNLILGSTQLLEAYTNRTMIETTYNFYLTGFPTGGIVLPVSPVSSITSIKYYDTSNRIQTWADTNYFWHDSEEPTIIKYVDSAPDTYDDRFDAVDVEFVAGYGDADAVPKNLRQSIMVLLTDLYENRMDNVREKFSTWKALAYHSRVFHFTGENQ